MTGATLLDLLMSRLGNRTEATLRETCLNEMILVQETLEKSAVLPWFLISEELSTVTPSDGVERRVEVPPRFLREINEDAFIILDADGNDHPLDRYDLGALIRKYGRHTAADLPKAYALQGEYYHLFPIPSVELPVYIRCYQSADTPTDSSAENAWMKNAPDLLMAMTGKVVAGRHLKDPDLETLFTGDIGPAQDRLIRENTAREESGRDRQMGES